MANLSIVQLCEKICDKPIVQIVTTGVTSLIRLQAAVEIYRKLTTKEILNFYNGIVDMIIVVYEGFEPQMDSVSYFYSYIDE